MIACTARVIVEDGTNVPADGVTTGEIALRGNNVMLGYLDDEEATAAAAPAGWLRTGDIGVIHPDGYVELRDRSKDVIISWGENIASVEVEQAIAEHPAVVEVAVIGVPDDKWGEVPAAHVTLHDGASATEDEIIAHVRARLSRFKAPKSVTFGALPKTSTGKFGSTSCGTRPGPEPSGRSGEFGALRRQEAGNCCRRPVRAVACDPGADGFRGNAVCSALQHRPGLGDRGPPGPQPVRGMWTDASSSARRCRLC
jgi:hypothetical protein